MTERALQINVYTCDYGHQTITGNINDGVTPFMIRCRGNWPHVCDSMARSCFYHCNQSLKPTHVWYKATTSRDEVAREVEGRMASVWSEMDQEHRNSVINETIEHRQQGGLELRRAQGIDLEKFGFRSRHG